MPRTQSRAKTAEKPKTPTLHAAFIRSPEYYRLHADQPVTAEVVVLMLKKTDELNRYIEFIKSTSEFEQRKAAGEQLLMLEKDIARIGAWLLGPTPRPSAEQLIADVNRYAEIWSSSDLALQYLDSQRMGKPGKQPTEARQEGLEAANERRKDPKLPWSQVARRVCRCGKPRHERKCAERLRIQVGELEAFLARFRA